MAIDPGAVGAVGDRRPVAWTSTDALLYAVGVGAGADDLAFSTENTRGVEQQVYPTFAVVVGSGTDSTRTGALRHAGRIDWSKVVHGSQGVTLHRPIPVSGEAVIQDRIAGIYDKGSAAVVVVEADVRDQSGDLMWSTRSALFLRGDGGWGGDRGPTGPAYERPDRAPDHVTSLPTSRDQALVYRLSGDRNPLHSDPEFARKAGFERPILHGLCTLGVSTRALLRSLCQDDTSRFHEIEGRFAAPVVPGEVLTVSSWNVGGGATVFETMVGDRVVIDRAFVRSS